MPVGQITKNCHYISRMLTRPWEGDQRRLKFYDFDSKRWQLGNSSSLFAAEGLNSQEVESWLDKTLEGPLSICRKRLASGQDKVLEDWGFYRAATLMLWLQGTRLKSISDRDARQSLKTLATKPEPEIDQLVAAFGEEYDLSVVFTGVENGRFGPVFFPSSGLFPVSYPDAGCLSGHSIALALPLDLRSALIALPKDQAGERDLSKVPGSISNLSVGVANAHKVIVPPLLLAQQPEEDMARILTEQRAANVKLFEMVKESKQLVAAAFEETGLEAPRDRTGRLPPVKATDPQVELENPGDGGDEIPD